MYAIKISEGGRVVVPAEVRKALGVTEGETLLGELRDGALVLTTRRAQLAASRRLFQQSFPPGSPSLADELIAERREAAANEDR
ncbi:MAG: AbrB/MazE/SpoVT family DNA-binding domain-containing protein [Chromatiaceae bacterium]|nr:AbrB/MazE/SpoVT family DNA-binding domain-containing protein [Chromatiaceae bacterium]